MPTHSDNNKRIAKNTVFLYFRMLLLMFLGFFTSRVTLDKLGAENYGIYNLVGGVIVLFQFFNSALTSACQRYLTYAIGEGDEDKIKKVFSINIRSYAVLSIVIFFLCETVGMVLLKTYLNIPEGRMFAAQMVLHISSVSTVVSMMRIPFNGAIIAEERMSFFAYTSILDGILKLVIVYMLSVGSFDKLILFAILNLLVTVLQSIIYVIYCKKNFYFITFKRYKDKELLKGILSFSGWNIMGSAATVLSNQGMSVVFNHFNGVLINAAMGIANQVNNAVYGFLSNFQTAFNPQIVKSYAQNDKDYLFDFINKSSKYSFFLLYFIIQPFVVNLNFVLNIWLKEVPAYSSEFIIVFMTFTLIDALAGPLWMLNEAEGNIKIYQLVGGVTGLLTLPVAYVFLLLGAEPYWALSVRAFQNLGFSVYRFFNLRKRTGFVIGNYLKAVYLRVGICAVPSFFITMTVHHFTTGVVQFFSSCIVSCVTLGMMYFLVGITNSEREKFTSFIKRKFKVVRQEER